MDDDAFDVKLMLHILDKRTKQEQSIDRVLYLLLRAHENDIPNSASWFHKAFRQVDVTGNGSVDMAIWHAIHMSKLICPVIDLAVKCKKYGTPVLSNRDDSWIYEAGF